VCAAIAFGTWSLIALGGSSLAQPGLADTQRGHELAVRLCIKCHIVDREASSPIRADVPTFAAIANRRGSPAEHLAARIIVPHPALPGVPQTAAKIRDIVAYIASLKRNN
jgi:cytochrome c